MRFTQIRQQAAMCVLLGNLKYSLCEVKSTFKMCWIRNETTLMGLKEKYYI